jgi:hypothetical protein
MGLHGKASGFPAARFPCFYQQTNKKLPDRARPVRQLLVRLLIKTRDAV